VDSVENPNPVLERAVRVGLITPEVAARHPDVRTPEDLLSRGLIRTEDAVRLYVDPDEDVEDGSRTRAVGEWLRVMREENATPPAAIGRYRILGTLGRGGMGIVYRAEDTTLGREVALKIMRPGFTPAEHLRFLREARAAAVLVHPHIVPVHDVGEADGRPYIVMELLEGRSLQDHIERRSLLRREEVELLRQASEAVAFAHAQGILHRDLKSSNILVTPERKAVVMDFGLAKVPGWEGPGLSVSGVTFGTPAYMSPEQARGQWKEVGERSDVYSLGATLYEILTGRPPFVGASLAETLQQVLSDEPSPPRTIDRTVKPDLERVCLKALEKDPRRRYPTARAFAEDLARWLAGEPVHASAPSIWGRVGRRLARRATWVGIAATAFVVGLLSFLPGFLPGEARISSSPPGAAIWVDGKETGQRTPAQVSLWPPGSHRISLVRSGYESSEFDVEIRSREKVEHLRELLPITGRLILDPHIPGTTVRLENAEPRACEESGIALPPGRHQVTVLRPNCFPWSQEVTIVPREELRLRVETASIPLWTVDAPSRFLVLIPDIDGDRVEDLVLADPADRTLVGLSGSRGRRLWKNSSAGPCAQIHSRGIGDVDRDGIPDFFVLGDSFVSAHSGKDGSPFWTHRGRFPVDLSHEYGDVDGDGVADFLATTIDAVALRSGRTGRQIWIRPFVESIPPALTLTRVGDLNGDGSPDAIVWLSGWATAVAYDGRAGAELWRNYSLPLLLVLRPLGDVNGDGREDLLATPVPSIPTESVFRCISGGDGKELWARSLRAWVDRSIVDIDRDGVADILCRTEDRRWVTLLSGRTGAVLWSTSPSAELGVVRLTSNPAVASDGGTVHFLSGRDGQERARGTVRARITDLLPGGDFDGDGAVDLVASSSDAGGRVWAFSAASGRILWEAKFTVSALQAVGLVDLGAEGPGLAVWSPSGITMLRARPR